MRCGVRCLDDVFSRVSGTTLKGGYIVVIQTHGRNGQYNPHLHIIATSGGWDPQASQWVHLDYVPYRHAAQEVAVASADDAAPDGEDARRCSGWSMRVTRAIARGL